MGDKSMQVVENDGKLARFHPIFLKQDERFNVKSSGMFWLSETPTVPGSKLDDASEVAMATWVKIVFSHKASVPIRGRIANLFREAKHSNACGVYWKYLKTAWF